MISQSKKFIYIHNPKTAGNSIQSVLNKYSFGEFKYVDHIIDPEISVGNYDLIDDPFGPKHTPISVYKNNWKPYIYGNWQTYLKITSIRNPWDRAISWYFWHNKEWDKETFKKTIYKCYPMTSMVCYADKLDMDYIIKYETLQEDFDNMCVLLKIDKVKLPQYNQTAHDDYRSYYDNEMVEIVAKLHSKDIELFDYTFE
jgi:hypothetical protein